MSYRNPLTGLKIASLLKLRSIFSFAPKKDYQNIDYRFQTVNISNKTSNFIII